MTTTARQLRSVHRQSAIFAQEAWLAKDNGQQDRSLELYSKAYALEKEVASAYVDLKDMEPTRSILLKSAAVLAKECGLFREAEQWLSHALAGNPPDEVAKELRTLFKSINKKQGKKATKAKPNSNVLTVVEGVFSMVDTVKHRIGVDAPEGRVKIEVPFDVNEIVKKYFDNPVKVTYQIEGRRKWLKQIQKAG